MRDHGQVRTARSRATAVRRHTGTVRRDGAAHLRPRERVRRHLHPPRPAPAQPRRGRPLPVPPGRVAGAAARNVFLENGARLYLDVGSHPEYATPECDSIHDLVVHDKAGERILEQLLVPAPSSACARRASAASSTCSRTTPTRPATPTAATRTTSPAGATTSATTPRCSSRSSCQPPDLRRRRQGAADGPGRDVLHQPAGRAHLGGRLVGHHPQPADHQHPRRAPRRRRALPPPPRHRGRLQHERVRHLPEGRAPRRILLRMLEDPAVVLRDMTLENPIRAIREISHDITCTPPGAPGQRPRGAAPSTSRREYLNRALRYAETKGLSARSRSRRSRCGSTASPSIENDPLDARPRVRLGHQAQA